jgi:hypothetical protein
MASGQEEDNRHPMDTVPSQWLMLVLAKDKAEAKFSQ